MSDMTFDISPAGECGAKQRFCAYTIMSTSRFISGLSAIPVAVCCFFLTLSCATSPDDMFEDRQFPSGGEKQVLKVEGKTARVCREVLGREYSASEIIYIKGQSFTVLSVEVDGKHGIITAEFAIRDGKIWNCRILSSREQRGRHIKSKRFLRQFFDAQLAGSGQLDKRIDGITGATTSSRSVQTAAVLALRLNGIINLDRQSK